MLFTNIKNSFVWSQLLSGIINPSWHIVGLVNGTPTSSPASPGVTNVKLKSSSLLSVSVPLGILDRPNDGVLPSSVRPTAVPSTNPVTLPS